MSIKKLPLLAIVALLPLNLLACGGGSGGTGNPPTSSEKPSGTPAETPDGADQTELPISAGHNLTGAGSFTVAPGDAVEQGNLVFSCPDGGNACQISVSSQGTASYSNAGGTPSVQTIDRFWTSDRIGTSFQTLSSTPSIRSFAIGNYATCAAIGCPEDWHIHVDYSEPCPGCFGSQPPDFSGFSFQEQRGGVPLAISSAGGNGYRKLGGWLDQSYFLVEADPEGSYSSYDAESLGPVSSGHPTLPQSGVATWSGAMAGVIRPEQGSGVAFPDNGTPSGPEANGFVIGNTTITVSLQAADRMLADVKFSDIVDLQSGSMYANLEWRNVEVGQNGFSSGRTLYRRDGTFGYISHDFPYDNNPHVSPNKLFGHFYGSGHAEVGGLFVTPTLAGAFGATRDEGVESNYRQ